METFLLPANSQNNKKAAELLLKGEVIGIPTETVYGLAADAFNPEAVKKIFIAKGRPQDNPLIVHISDMSQLEQVASDIPSAAYKMAEAFWPGPLTMIFRRSPLIPDEVTAGLDTVGVRMPSHRVAREIIALSRPLAAPSANTSGKPSPTAASHVYEDMRGRVPMIIDGGRCSVGVESTVVDMTGDVPRVLRPGAITEEMIANLVGAADTDRAVKVGLAEGERAKSPGMKYRHYAPKSPVRLYEGAPEDTFDAIMNEETEGRGVICFEEYKKALKEKGFKWVYSIGQSWNHAAHGKNIFSVLRRFDSTKAELILAQCPREFGSGQGTVNRMRKAAGFSCIACSDKTIIGVTGASGSGKSRFSAALASALGDCLLLDADKIYHGLLGDGKTPLCEKILEAFPNAERDGALDRKKLGAIVFADREALKTLNGLTHPAVIKKTLDDIKKTTHKYIVTDVPLLFESHFDRYCTMTIGLLADRKKARARIMERDNISGKNADARLKGRPTARLYTKRADLVVNNDGGVKELEKAASSIAAKYLL